MQHEAGAGEGIAMMCSRRWRSDGEAGKERGNSCLNSASTHPARLPRRCPYACKIQALLKPPSLVKHPLLDCLILQSDLRTVADKQLAVSILSARFSSIQCVFPSQVGEYPGILEVATTVYPTNLSSWQTTKSYFSQGKKYFSSPCRLFYSLNYVGLFPFPTASHQSNGISKVIYTSFERAYADKSRYLNQFLNRMAKNVYVELFFFL